MDYDGYIDYGYIALSNIGVFLYLVSSFSFKL